MALPTAPVTSDANRLLTIAQVVEMTNLAPATIYRLMASRTLICIRIGRATRIPARCLEDFIQARLDEATADLPQPRYAPMRVRPKRASRKGAA